jgi:site-specific DNA recombinase
MNAVIYARVSTKEQAEKGFSLEAQEEKCKAFAKANNYSVDKVFVERGESAKTQNRTQLGNLIKYAVQNKKKLSALIIWKFDRLARNLGDQIELLRSFNSMGIMVLSATENNEDSSFGNFIRNVMGSVNQFENDVRRDRTINGMQQAVKEGRWCWKGPTGYRNTRDISNKPIIVPSDNSVHIKKAFQLFETGLYKQTDIVRELKRDGFNAKTSTINSILQNPIYMGYMRVSWFPELIKGIHEPLVSMETFQNIQLILKGKRPHLVPSFKRKHNDFPLRRFVRCPKCDAMLTGGWSTGHKKKKYGYYHCATKGCSFNVKKEDIEGSFFNYLQSYQPKKEILGLFGAVVTDVWDTAQGQRIKEKNRIETDLKALEEEREKVDKFALKEIFSEEAYQRNYADVTNRIEAKRLEYGGMNTDLKADLKDCLDYCKFFIGNVASLWAQADVSTKQRFQALIFPDKTYYEAKTFRTTATSIIFNYLQLQTTQKSNMVALSGFEPES